MAAEQLLRGEVLCFESGWCDYSREHRVIRSRLEAIIDEHANGGRVRLPVIVAPYGSGKTKLLEHLEWYARSKSIPVARVELAALVAYIRDRKGNGVHESGLAGLVEEFFETLTGSRRGVLLVDEVEEAYDQLAGLVEYETSPFRGLADAVYRGELGVLPVLAFGPSSMLKEAVFGPVAWRSIILQIPLVPPRIVEKWLEPLSEASGPVSLLANTVWWASKGRPGWAELASTALSEAYQLLVEGSAEEAFERLMESEALSTEVVEGVPLLDKKGLRDLERETGSAGLAAALALMVGPIPSGFLAERGLLGAGGGGAYIVSNRVAYVDELLEKAEEVLSRLGRARGLGQQSLERAIYALRLVLQAWSDGERVAYDTAALREISSLAGDLARELYPNDIGAQALLEELPLDSLGVTAERLRSPVVALRPSRILHLYPLASSTPLVGCAKRAGAGRVVELVSSLGPGELAEYSSRVGEELGVKGIVVAPAGMGGEDASTLACRAASKTVIVVAPPGQEPAVPSPLRAGEKLGAIRLAVLTGKPSLLLYSLIYNQATGCNTSLSAPEQHVLRVYGAAIRAAIQEAGKNDAIASRLSRIESLASRLLEAGLGDLVEPLVELIAYTAGKGLGIDALRSLVEVLGIDGEIAENLAREIGELLEELPDETPSCLLEHIRNSYRFSYHALRVTSSSSGEPYIGGLEDLVEATKAGLEPLLEDMPLEGLAAEALEKLRSLELVLTEARGLASRIKCKCLSELVERYSRRTAKSLEPLKARLEEIKRQYQGVLEMASKLPGQARDRALKAIQNALLDSLRENSIEPLVEVSEPLAALLMYAAKASEYEQKIAELVKEVDEILSGIIAEASTLAHSGGEQSVVGEA